MKLKQSICLVIGCFLAGCCGYYVSTLPPSADDKVIASSSIRLEHSTATATASTAEKVFAPQVQGSRVRVLVERNLTPVYIPNPDYVDDGKHSDPDKNHQPRMVRNTPTSDYLSSLGAEGCFIVTKGTLNRSPWWSTRKDLQDVLTNGWGGAEGNFSDPPTQASCQAVGRLTRNPGWFSSDARPSCPLIFDIEFTQEFATSWDKDTASKQKYLKYWDNTLKWTREGAGADQEIAIYGHDYVYNNAIYGPLDPSEVDPFINLGMRKLSMQVSGVAFANYFWDLPATNKQGRILSEAAQEQTLIRRYCPELAENQFVFLNPTNQIWFPENDPQDVVDSGGKLVPYQYWCRLVDFYVARRVNIVLWCGWGKYDKQAEPYYVYACQYGITPRGAAAKWLGTTRN